MTTWTTASVFDGDDVIKEGARGVTDNGVGARRADDIMEKVCHNISTASVFDGDSVIAERV